MRDGPFGALPFYAMPQTFPVTSLRFRDLVLRVAEYMGMADYGEDGNQPAGVPQNQHDLDLAKRIVNDGYRRFISNNDRWRFLYQYFELQLTQTVGPQHVDGEIHRYRMPWFFNGVAMRDWHFNDDSYHHPIRIISEAEVQMLLSQTSETSGPPHYCAFRRIAPAKRQSQERRLWEAVFQPKPSEQRVVNIMIRAFPTGMQDLDDYHFAGAEYDSVIEAAVLSEAELQRDDQAGVQTQLYLQQLAAAKAIDAESAPRSVGFNYDQGHTTGRFRGNREFWYTGVDSYNGTPIDAAS